MPLTVQVRRPVLIAVGAILLGLLAAVVAHVVIRDSRARLQTRLALGRTRDELERVPQSLEGGYRDDEERRVADALAAEIDALDADAGAEEPTTESENVAVMVTKVRAFPRWIAVRRNIVALPPELQGDLPKEARAIATSLVSRGVIKADADKLDEQVDALVANLRTHLRAAAKERVTALRDTLRSVVLDPSQRRRVEERLAEADRWLQGEQASGEGALAILADAQQDMVDDGVARIQAFLGRLEHPPGLQQPHWEQLGEDVAALLPGPRDTDPARALEKLRRADTTLLDGLLRPLEEAAARVTVAADKAAATEKATAARAALNEDRLQDARTAYTDLVPLLRSGGGFMTGKGVAPAAAPADLPPVASALGGTPMPSLTPVPAARPAEPLVSIRRKIRVINGSTGSRSSGLSPVAIREASNGSRWRG